MYFFCIAYLEGGDYHLFYENAGRKIKKNCFGKVFPVVSAMEHQIAPIANRESICIRLLFALRENKLARDVCRKREDYEETVIHLQTQVLWK